MSKTRLSMESARSIFDVCDAYLRGRISASRARGHIEAVVFDGLDIEDIDPRDLGGSEPDALMWMLARLARGGLDHVTPAQLATRVDMPKQRVAELLGRMSARGDVTRKAHGVYRCRR